VNRRGEAYLLFLRKLIVDSWKRLVITDYNLIMIPDTHLCFLLFVHLKQQKYKKLSVNNICIGTL